MAPRGLGTSSFFFLGFQHKLNDDFYMTERLVGPSIQDEKQNKSSKVKTNFKCTPIYKLGLNFTKKSRLWALWISITKCFDKNDQSSVC